MQIHSKSSLQNFCQSRTYLSHSTTLLKERGERNHQTDISQSKNIIIRNITLEKKIMSTDSLPDSWDELAGNYQEVEEV